MKIKIYLRLIFSGIFSLILFFLPCLIVTANSLSLDGSEFKKVKIYQNGTFKEINVLDPTSLAFIGDVLLGSRMESLVQQNGADFPFRFVRPYLESVDLSVANLENPITDCTSKTPGKSQESIEDGRNYVFKVSKEIGRSAVQNSGIDVFSLANNHVMDYQGQGLKDTIKIFGSEGIGYVGAGRNDSEASSPRIFEANGQKVGIAAYSMVVPPLSAAQDGGAGINKFDMKKMKENISELTEKADIVVVVLHWGKEGSNYPGSYQIDIAHVAIDAGANLVVGHHPHVLQGIEVYNGGLIAYSLGNFVFTQGFRYNETAVLYVYFLGGKIQRAEVKPILIDNGQPRPVWGIQTEAINNKIIRFSNVLGEINWKDSRDLLYIPFDFRNSFQSF
jgi:poly-gamma-glutamate synthesis protein (capsule biosynthesis protein)